MFATMTAFLIYHLHLVSTGSEQRMIKPTSLNPGQGIPDPKRKVILMDMEHVSFLLHRPVKLGCNSFSSREIMEYLECQVYFYSVAHPLAISVMQAKGRGGKNYGAGGETTLSSYVLFSPSALKDRAEQEAKEHLSRWQPT